MIKYILVILAFLFTVNVMAQPRALSTSEKNRQLKELQEKKKYLERIRNERKERLDKAIESVSNRIKSVNATVIR